ncbi:hypothetical protein DFA_06710 [Cavenderia fasciculata]|uniref:Uncharacterized protein n=1 Tax=Cavenderia fasciculata TaxID=261658 RepID=F4Q223_CACFS|nr:uncharacterized protein DFA_06710 [Cavenderia fasciculata]EGG18043.1 hypothetical protein DFA_06710 [Cavenderia fasciculata]|eukprot:XP_004356936.1 hypothetical protein DFA_06710 [Cavenderia fasciculata]
MSLFASLSKIGSINNTNSIKQSSSNNSMIISMNNGSSIQSENMNAFSKPFWGKCDQSNLVNNNNNHF